MITQCVVGFAEAKLAAYAAYPARLGCNRRLLCNHFFLRANVRGLINPG
jgi:hypothetical protein